ncbi:beta-ketoacyl-[acyl-carrier-protein] synthase family protein [Novosphingobium sp. fls2-241-R2A-195]|jgi:nodulation protein E|uniref:beta-ketoacyl-[acyl-carrier-protein] synthase family protein n=1 Tax=Novosphingobium sp. fls2-241-R2A-195 TaxID=3040296 RepID=UPI00254F57F4|nr:beta-ketoacyl-[acyl-carrier-protein] synthase family protein [Novosphingobium sp. fls2-241-R2A-195]
MTNRVLITGLGCVSGLGRGVGVNWERVRGGDGAIRPLEPPAPEGIAAWFDDDKAHEAVGQSLQRSALHRSALLGNVDPERLRRLGKLDRLSSFALEAGLEAVTHAGLLAHPALVQRTAILLGCGSGGNGTIETAYERLFAAGQSRVHPQTIPSSMIAAPAAQLSMLLGVHGPVLTLSGACASSAQALGEAMHMIRAGRADVVIAGGAEACLTRGSLTGWQSLGVLAPDTCRPFSRDRRGMVLGEGAAVLVLESERHAHARGARVLGELAGYGVSSDATHMTAPDVEGIAAAIRAAHEDAGIGIDTPALVSAHGTGTALNDPAEAAAMHRVYGPALAHHRVIATKSAHGHMIGATGAIEFLLGLVALSEGIAPPVLNHLGPDPDCDLPLVLAAQEFAPDVLVSNSFAFGGLNAVLVGRRA